MFRPQEGRLVETPSNWALYDPIIPLGYFAVNSDGSGAKTGDGVNKWSDLSYIGSSTIGSKSIQTDRNPVDKELLVFCSGVDKWVYRLQGCLDTETNWASDASIYPTLSMLIELDDSTNRPTGRFKISDGVTAFPTLPWFGSEFDLTSWPTGYSVEFNGTIFEPASYVHVGDLQASTIPVGKFHRDDGNWAYTITGPITSTNNGIAVYDGLDGSTLKDSG